MPILKLTEGFKEIKKLHDSDKKGHELPLAFISKMLQNCWIERYKKGEYIIRKGDLGKNFYIIISGCAQKMIVNDEKAKALNELEKRLIEEKKRAKEISNTGAKLSENARNLIYGAKRKVEVKLHEKKEKE